MHSWIILQKGFYTSMNRELQELKTVLMALVQVTKNK